MQALTVVAAGTSKRLELTDVPEPKPQSQEVAIIVTSAGIGLIDAFWGTGVMPQLDNFIPGLEVAGVISAVGAQVKEFTVGQKVAAILPAAGGFAEVVCTHCSLVAAIPEGMGYTQAAVVPINSVTAHLGLTTVARLAAGESVLVHAGTGGLGSQFGQIARILGATRVDAVVGTAAKAQLAKELGFDNVYLRDNLDNIEYDTFDIVIDPVGGNATTTGFAALRAGGRLVRVGNASQAADVSLSSMAHWLENKTTAGFNVGAWLSAHPQQATESLRWALSAVASGQLLVPVTQTGGLGDHQQLMSALLAGDTTGKLAFELSAHTT